jgi:dTDP-4-amino-4,6-dideoxygalactose transaminase
MQPIHLFSPVFRVEETLEALRECLEKGWTGLGFKTVEFEEAWRAYTGLPHAHFLNSATAGLHLAMRLLKQRDGWRDGDEIITTPFTFVSTNHAIVYERLRPVFADIDEHLCLDPESVLARLTERTRAVVFVGLGGSTGQLTPIAEICAAQGLRLILDAAHMAGTRLHGRHVGYDADATVFSYQAVKNLPTGDAGMICFADPALDREVRKSTWLGISKDTYSRTLSGAAYKWVYDVDHVGFKYHGNSIMAAMALVGLRYLDADNMRRREIAGWYEDAIGSSPVIDVIPTPAGCESSRHLFQVMVDGRDNAILALNDADIYPGVHYRDNTEYAMYRYAAGTCPSAAAASGRIISLPMHLRLRRADVQRICQSLKDAVTHRRSAAISA